MARVGSSTNNGDFSVPRGYQLPCCHERAGQTTVSNLRQADGDVGSQEGIVLILVEPRKPDHSDYVESFHACLRHECTSEQWFPALLHAHSSAESRRRECSEEVARRAFGGLTPVQ
jgi:hypothetical protein